MDMITTIPVTTQVTAPAEDAPDVCWCGQDLDRVRGRHCSRCGTARATRSVATLSRLAA
jgi:hypothetical protein